MNSNTAFSGNPQWAAWQKITFRFFFILFTLQLFTDNFFAVWAGEFLLSVVKVSDKIFVRPTMWLNNHIFHFYYTPLHGFTFSASLHTIRDITYLFLACSGCIAWTVIDRKRTNYNKLLYWFSQCLIVALSCMLFAYGIIKLFPVQMQAPSLEELNTRLGDLSPFELLWSTFGYGKPYQVFSGCLEVLAALLVLFKRTRVAGLLISVAIFINIILVNYTYRVGVLITACYLLLMTLFLLAPYAKPLVRFFFTGQPVVLLQNRLLPGRKNLWLKIIAILFIGTSFSLNTHHAIKRYTTRNSVSNSRQYSLVKNYVVNNDTLQLIENDTTRWRTWNESIRNGKRMVTISAMRPGAEKTYLIEQDSAKHCLTLRPYQQADTTSLCFSYADIDKLNWRLNGTVQQKNIWVELQKFDPDTTLNLLKLKRVIINFDEDFDDK